MGGGRCRARRAVAARPHTRAACHGGALRRGGSDSAGRGGAWRPPPPRHRMATTASARAVIEHWLAAPLAPPGAAAAAAATLAGWASAPRHLERLLAIALLGVRALHAPAAAARMLALVGAVLDTPAAELDEDVLCARLEGGLLSPARPVRAAALRLLARATAAGHLRGDLAILAIARALAARLVLDRAPAIRRRLADRLAEVLRRQAVVAAGSSRGRRAGDALQRLTAEAIAMAAATAPLPSDVLHVLVDAVPPPPAASADPWLGRLIDAVRRRCSDGDSDNMALLALLCATAPWTPARRRAVARALRRQPLGGVLCGGSDDDNDGDDGDDDDDRKGGDLCPHLRRALRRARIAEVWWPVASGPSFDDDHLLPRIESTAEAVVHVDAVASRGPDALARTIEAALRALPVATAAARWLVALAQARPAAAARVATAVRARARTCGLWPPPADGGGSGSGSGSGGLAIALLAAYGDDDDWRCAPAIWEASPATTMALLRWRPRAWTPPPALLQRAAAVHRPVAAAAPYWLAAAIAAQVPPQPGTAAVASALLEAARTEILLTAARGASSKRRVERPPDDDTVLIELMHVGCFAKHRLPATAAAAAAADDDDSSSDGNDCALVAALTAAGRDAPAAAVRLLGDLLHWRRPPLAPATAARALALLDDLTRAPAADPDAAVVAAAIRKRRSLVMPSRSLRLPPPPPPPPAREGAPAGSSRSSNTATFCVLLSQPSSRDAVIAVLRSRGIRVLPMRTEYLDAITHVVVDDDTTIGRVPFGGLLAAARGATVVRAAWLRRTLSEERSLGGSTVRSPVSRLLAGRRVRIAGTLRDTDRADLEQLIAAAGGVPVVAAGYRHDAGTGDNDELSLVLPGGTAAPGTRVLPWAVLVRRLLPALARLPLTTDRQGDDDPSPHHRGGRRPDAG